MHQISDTAAVIPPELLGEEAGVSVDPQQVALVDLQMPGMDGLEVCRQLVQHGEDVRNRGFQLDGRRLEIVAIFGQRSDKRGGLPSPPLQHKGGGRGPPVACGT